MVGQDLEIPNHNKRQAGIALAEGVKLVQTVQAVVMEDEAVPK